MDAHLKEEPTKEEATRLLQGARICAIAWETQDTFGRVLPPGELIIKSIAFSNGYIIYFEASGQVERDDVWVHIERTDERRGS